MNRKLMFHSIIQDYPAINHQEVKGAIDRIYDMDESQGCTEADFGVIMAIRTCILAIQAGLQTNDNSTMYDAIVMLHQIILKQAALSRAN